MSSIVHIHTGEVKVGCHDEILQSTPIGSCVVIMAWSAEARMGGMAHIMLPGRAPKTTSVPTKYTANAVEALAESLAPHASLRDIGVCLVGAANVLNKTDDTICQNNQHSVAECLRKADIPVHATVLGGNRRRMACLYVPDGRMTYTEGGSEERTLWQSVGS